MFEAFVYLEEDFSTSRYHYNKFVRGLGKFNLVSEFLKLYPVSRIVPCVTPSILIIIYYNILYVAEFNIYILMSIDNDYVNVVRATK